MHGLVEPSSRDLVAAARTIGGAHAQIAASAALSLCLRTRDTTAADVRAELWERRRLVKAPLLRGTLHLLPADELGTWLAANRCRDREARRARAGFDAALIRRAGEAVAESVGSAPLTKRELRELVLPRLGSWGVTFNRGWAGRMENWEIGIGEAALAGALLRGPDRGRETTYVGARDWVGAIEETSPEQALAIVLKRFLHAYGPSLPNEFARWFAIEPKLARAVFAAVHEELLEIDVDGERRWLLAADGGAFPGPAAGVQLLPHFDPFVVGSLPRLQLIPAGGRMAAAAPGTAAPFAVLLVAGQVAGVWSRRARGARLEITVDSHVELDPSQRAELERQAARIGAALGLAASLRLAPLPLRPHL